jgi:hypothetical protein
MEYMEQKMQEFMEAGMLEFESLMSEFNPPSDWENPEWGVVSKVHNWRNYVSDGLQKEWVHLTGRQKIVVSSCLDNIADREDWD